MDEIRLMGARIKTLREFHEWTQGQLAYKASTTTAQVSRLENDERPGAQAILIARLAAALNTNTDYLLGRTNDPSALKESNRKYKPHLYIRAMRLLEICEYLDSMDLSGESSDRLLMTVLNQADAVVTAVRAVERHEEQRHRESRGESGT